MKVTCCWLSILLWTVCYSLPSDGGYYRPNTLDLRKFEDIRAFLAAGLSPNVRQLYDPDYYFQRAYQEHIRQHPYDQDTYQSGTYVQNPFYQGNSRNPFINRNRGSYQGGGNYNGDPYSGGDVPRSLPEQ